MNNPNDANPPDRPLWKSEISRRDFVDLVIKGGIFTTIAGMLFPALAYVWPVMRRGPSVDMEEVAGIDEIPVWGAKKVIVGGSALMVIRTPNGYKALSAICTHLGCLVDWNNQRRQIVCPCHAGVFDVEGRNISGPPPRPLASYEVKIMDGKIFVKV